MSVALAFIEIMMGQLRSQLAAPLPRTLPEACNDIVQSFAAVCDVASSLIMLGEDVHVVRGFVEGARQAALDALEQLRRNHGDA